MNLDDPRVPDAVRALAREIAASYSVLFESVVPPIASDCVVVSLPWDCDEGPALHAAGFTPDICTDGLDLGAQDWTWRAAHPSPAPRRFRLMRNADVSGVSGTGHVADGVLFGDGTTVIRWRSAHRSTAVYACLRDAIKVHGHGGATRVQFIDGGAE